MSAIQELKHPYLSDSKIYYIYHIPGKKVGVTSNPRMRIEKQQGYKQGEYEIIEKSNDINYVSDKEIEYQKMFGYKVDRQKYKDLKLKHMKVNITEQTTTFPVPKAKLKGNLMDNMGYKWETSFGEIEINKESAVWIEKNCKTSMFNPERCFIYNKAYAEAFSNPQLSIDYNENYFELIRDWAEERGIFQSGDSKTQYTKLMEEAGELAQGILKNKPTEVKDAIGDMVVVLTNLAKLNNMNIEDCIIHAYNEIKNRKGKMKNGTFVKEI